ncbi:hypothetical protein SAMN05444169_7649 [Bradyrhizobium erythrophlei]|uniref:Uncharacterized protein n=1 Tax=Bradyrhizobium erythrophlei TaxID=1437360 RepID=A0A1M5TAJ2_9BRAD|nr:hypothetical protein SAMN05444169_7649 [Bradyrhizobium erythrophlei]
MDPEDAEYFFEDDPFDHEDPDINYDDEDDGEDYEPV